MSQKRDTLFSIHRLRKRLGALLRQPVFWFITLWGHVFIALGTFSLYYLEYGINPNVHSLLDTLFWAVATVTTVGYGDVVPVTAGGKVIGIFMMILGSIFLWSYTALFVGAIVSPELKFVEDEVSALERELRKGRIR